jgi:ABC-type multidrug transport system ATPase subunit/predicted component of type VI protein secretion system
MARWSLLVQSGEGTGHRIPLDAELLIGRAVEGQGRLLGDPKVSREHARVKQSSEGTLVIEDLRSANGTLVDGDVLPAFTPRELEPGAVIQIGGTVLRVDREASATPSVTPAGGPTEGPSMPNPRGLGAEAISREPMPDRQPAPPVEQVGSPSSIRAPLRTGERPPPAEILWAANRIPIPRQGLTIGRGAENDLVVESTRASRRHARVLVREGRYFLADLRTRNGTQLNGELLRDESRWLNSGDTIQVGDEILRFLTGEETRIGGRVEAPVEEARVVQLEGDSLTVGRDPSNDVVLDDPNVSRFHAMVTRDGGRVELRDLGSRNGTRLDHEFISTRATIRAGSEIGVGPFRLVFDGTRFVRRDDRGALRLRAEEISTAVDGHVILNRASISIDPGELVVIIGESGSGKTTLIKALAGVVSPSKGIVTVNGEPVLTRLTDIGYVPQDEIVHPRLTVLEALRYAAALRLPRDSSEADIETAVRSVLEELSLTERAETRIGSLSGGQRKRVGVATELLNRPSLLFLDEPTTGLDPGLETRLMELLRDLAEEGRRAVTVVTHATKNLDLADRVCVMGQGGELTFLGPPANAKDFFAVGTYDGIYTALDERPVTEWRREFDQAQAELVATAESDVEALPAAPPRRVSRPRPNVGRQASLLAHRYLKLLVRDRRNLALLLGQVPLIALGIALLFRQGILVTGAGGSPGKSALLLFLAVTTAIWLGSIDGSREIIKERAVFERERAVGVRLGAYLASKAIVLFGLVAVQCAVLVMVLFGLRPLHESGDTYLLVFVLLALTGFVAVGMGLLISSIVSSEDQAASFIPLALIPQLLFGGAIVAVNEMGSFIKAVSVVVFARWSFAAVGTVIHMNDRLFTPSPDAATKLDAARYGSSFFDVSFGVSVLVLVAFLIAFFVATGVRLNSRRAAG